MATTTNPTIPPNQYWRCTKPSLATAYGRLLKKGDIVKRTGVQASSYAYFYGVGCIDGATDYIHPDKFGTDFEEITLTPKEVFELNPKSVTSHLISSGYNQGLDPEVFAVDAKGRVLPAFQFLPAKDATKGMVGAPFWDGFQAEFTTNPKVCFGWLGDEVQAGLRRVYEAATRAKKGAKLVATPVLPVSMEDLATAAEEHVQFGCSPSKNVYGLRGNDLGNPRQLPIRFAGFHIHYSLPDPHPAKFVEKVVRLQDAILGPILTSTLEGLEQPERRHFYGLAGEYRTPKYGVEYRVPSSAVLWHPAMVHLTLNAGRMALKLVMEGKEDLWEVEQDATISTINNLDVGEARRTLRANRRLLEGWLEAQYFNCKAAKIFDGLLMHGWRGLVELDMVANWSLTGLWQTHTNNNKGTFATFAKGQGWMR